MRRRPALAAPLPRLGLPRSPASAPPRRPAWSAAGPASAPRVARLLRNATPAWRCVGRPVAAADPTSPAARRFGQYLFDLNNPHKDSTPYSCAARAVNISAASSSSGCSSSRPRPVIFFFVGQRLHANDNSSATTTEYNVN
ncbi:hypothetical protein U9M48_028090 [Paspalum notatum var. saurae]|uniref:Uncharacterized protein n=1 Tax=Paspalum notatum var. saurae TaxID=547442 RepID=A0AAQ3X0P7_PASNO